MTQYECNTVDAANPLARFAHRRRIAYSTRLARQLAGTRPMLDYGCGTGSLVASVNQARPNLAIGFEPFMEANRPSVFRDFRDVEARGPYSPITLFEVIEHLNERELDELTLRQRGWHVEILSYGPLPVATWYGNSQAYMLARRATDGPRQAAP